MSLPIVKNFSKTEYGYTYELMREYTQSRNTDSADEFWVTEHYPVYTLGLAGDNNDLLNNNHDIPVFQSDRGGQITYHGEGQIIIYTLINLTRQKIGVRKWVENLEGAVIDFVKTQNPSIFAHRINSKPGVYIDNKKLSALGLKVKKGCCYHGLAINVNCNLTPFENINPCGYAGMEVTSLFENDIKLSPSEVASEIIKNLIGKLNYA